LAITKSGTNIKTILWKMASDILDVPLGNQEVDSLTRDFDRQ